MMSMRARFLVLVLVLATACGADPMIGRVTLGLGEVPEDVKTVAFTVFDLEREIVVASATVTAPNTTVELGVPAELPLEFRAIARTDRPGPRLAGGTMPAYVARAQRVVPLRDDQLQVDLLARPAGVLSFVTRFGVDADDDVVLELVDETESGRPVRVRVERPGVERAVVLPVGRYTATAEEHVVPEGDGLFVARQSESIAVLSVHEERDRTGAESMALRLVDETGEPCDDCRFVATATDAEADVSLAIDAFDESTGPVDVEDVTVTFAIDAVPSSILVREPSPATALPARIDGLRVRGQGRLIVTAAASGDLDARATLFLDVGATGGRPDHLALSFEDEDPSALAEGTILRILILDAEDRFARSFGGRVDFTASDPFVHLPEGRSFALIGDEQGVVERRVARPSGLRGVPVTLVATLTSTTVPGTWTSTLTLPLLELEEER
jgi:hypothetical protein